MARIRAIKPEFFRHSGLFDAEQESGLPLRLAFAGLWTVADREGRFKWAPRELKLDCLPHDQVDFGAVLSALAQHGFVQRYTVGVDVFGCIPGWAKHQVINTREAQSVIPSPPHGKEDAGADLHAHAHAESGPRSHVPNGVNLPAPLRATVIARDGGKCLRCGATEDLTVDHIFPQSLGGTHAIGNLRCLCRPCNSARPVQGQSLLDDLKKDGLSLDDMPRMCMHVHAQGEGKGKEGKGRGREVASATAVAGAPPKPAPTRETWGAYASAYESRYSAQPVANAKVNGQLSQLVARLGAEEAPKVAGWYVGLDDPFYVRQMHAVDALLSDAEKLRTRWATGRQGAPPTVQVLPMAGKQAAIEQHNRAVGEAWLAKQGVA